MDRNRARAGLEVLVLKVPHGDARTGPGVAKGLRTRKSVDNLLACQWSGRKTLRMCGIGDLEQGARETCTILVVMVVVVVVVVMGRC